MIIFLYGSDSFRSKEKLNEIVDGYKKVHKSGLNLVYFDCKEKTFKDLQNIFKVAGMFAEKKLIVLKNLFGNKKFQEDFLESLKDLESAKDIIIIFEDDKVDERLKIFKDLKGQAKCQEFEFLSGVLLKNWAKKEIEKQNAKIEDIALNLLISFAGNDLWQLSNEIKKISNYKVNKIITSDDIKLLVKPKFDNDIFNTVEALASKNKKTALNLMQKHIEAGDSPFYLLSMITYQFRVLITLKDLIDKKTPQYMITKKSGLHPFVAQKCLPITAKFSFEDLKRIYNKIFKIDCDIKTGRLDPELALDMLIAEI